MRILFLLFFFFSFSFAINDYLIKPIYKNFRVLSKIDTIYPESLDNNLTNDDKNLFFTKGHFRVIVGIDYNDSKTIKNLANNILDIMQKVWQKEIEDFKFKLPLNSNKNYIDVYIGNKYAYNPEIGYVFISDAYDGYATAYSDGTPYFVINPDIELNILKVTLAHEFFHTIQYAYGLDKVNNDIWNKNIWFLEATAVMMEDEVFDNINDYVNYLNYYLPYTNLALDYANGGIEYGKVLFAKFIKEKYGIKKIKKIFEDYETNETILDDIKKEFNFDKLMLNYAKCLANEKNCFKEGVTYPKIKTFSQNNNKKIYHYGILFLNNGNDSYLNSLNNEYLQEDFNGTLNKIININKTGLIIINKQKDILNESIISKNDFSFLKVKKGWNLISNIFAKELNLTKIDGLVWVYRNGKYLAYSNNETYKKAIQKANLEIKNKMISKNEGFWFYSNKDYNLTINNSNLADNNVSLKKGWHIVGFSSVFYPKYINSKIIWNYDNSWKYYSNKYDLNYSKINLLTPYKAYFIQIQK